ncbi:MAG: hypothetical protein B6U89_04740 [Desulfurococcales archaeon ex4484_58]|nr:MAG: hypothetical protein B6U89_04740 [Desulfurococcales archaeon ex4484_58]
MVRYCIYCGVEDSIDNPVINGVCLNCRMKRGELVVVNERNLYIELCRSCFSVRIGYKWRESTGFDDAIEQVVYSVLKNKVKPGEGVSNLTINDYELITTPSWRTIVRVYFRGVYGGKEFEYPIDFTIYFKPVKCPRCKMIDSGEFEAVVQIRGIDSKLLDKIFEKIVSRDRRFVENIVDIIETRNGVDLYFYDHGTARKMAKQLSKYLKLRIKENYEVTGMRSGVSRARLYISLKPQE